MFKATGKGKIDVLADTPSAGVLIALLYNFDFDDFYMRQWRPLKTEHTKFLLEKALPLLENDRGAVWLQGSASRIGTNPWNMETSMVRASRIQQLLANSGVNHDQIQPDAIGEEGAVNHALDDERDRSVKMWVFPKFKYDPPPPRRVPPKPLISTKFKIAMLTGLSASHAAKHAKWLKMKFGAGFAIDVNFFIVWDTKNNLSCMYVYVGLGIGLGLALPIGATTPGPWNEFETDAPMSVWQFGRWARFTTAGAGSKSVNYIHIETPKGVSNVYETINTGTTMGAVMSSTVGDFIRIEGPARFTGP
jgi:hypothetical protein